MRIDVLTIFPDYLAPLQLSLIGKAIVDGLLDLRVHDLREWTHDRHRTVDDTPYGGGAGMVMKPEPWGEALDALLASYGQLDASPLAGPRSDAQPGFRRGDAPLNLQPPTLIFPSPSGEVFNQQLACDLARRPSLAFACGRYEGIDQRVIDWAHGSFEVLEISIGDYVLNGGEVAAMVMIEAIGRLLPGVLGNPQSLVEESHSQATQGLLEYPVYTKPASWRGLQVPDVLLSGHHGRIAAWRAGQSRKLTARRRPDLLGQMFEGQKDLEG